MRKKMLASAAALMMAVVMATSAFAATASVTLGGSVEVTGAGVTNLSVSEYQNEGGISTETMSKGGAAVLDATGLTKEAIDKAIQDSNVSFDSDILTNVAAALDVSATYDPNGGVAVPTLNFAVDGIADKTPYVVLHYSTSKAVWEVAGAGYSVGNTVTGRFTDFSPVIVLTQAPASTTPPVSAPVTEEEDSSSSYTPAAQTTTAAAPVLAPQTGVNSAEALAAVAVVAGAAVAAFAVKKIKE